MVVHFSEANKNCAMYERPFESVVRYDSSEKLNEVVIIYKWCSEVSCEYNSEIAVSKSIRHLWSPNSL
jgi:hypothetical protein